MAAIRQQFVAGSKAEQAAEIGAALDRIARLHEARFQPVTQRSARPAAVDNQMAILQAQLTQHLNGVSRLKLRQWRKAKQDAAWAAYRQIDEQYQAGRRRNAAEQARLDGWWARLRANDRDAVIDELIAAFADNEAAAAPLDVEGDTASVLVYLPPLSSLPDRQPAVTPAGNLSLRKMTKAQSAVQYKRFIAGFVIATAKEAFAVAPGLQHVAILAVRDGKSGSNGGTSLECIVATRLSRENLRSVNWTDSDSISVLTASAEELRLNQRGAAQSWEPISLDEESEIRLLIESIER